MRAAWAGRRHYAREVIVLGRKRGHQILAARALHQHPSQPACGSNPGSITRVVGRNEGCRERTKRWSHQRNRVRDESLNRVISLKRCQRNQWWLGRRSHLTCRLVRKRIKRRCKITNAGE